MKKTDYFTASVVCILFLIIVRIFYLVFSEKYILSAEDIVGIMLFLFGLRLLTVKSTAGEFIILVLILLVLGDTLKINLNFGQDGYSSQSYVSIGSLTFRPFGLLLLIFYALINRSSISSHIRNLRFGSPGEQVEKYDKKVSFYYQKFSQCQPEEYNTAIKIIGEYPEEAQIALRRLVTEKGETTKNSGEDN